MAEFDARFQSVGFLQVDELLTQSELRTVLPEIDSLRPSAAGDRRLLEHVWCIDLAHLLLTRMKSMRLVSGEFVATLCTYFEKTDESNWGVAPHRDICVPVKSRFDAADWRNWSEKQGIPHGQPPRALLESMFAIRLHTDSSTRDNGALLVTPGSHTNDAASSPEHVIEGPPGSALVMSPLIMHASKKSSTGKPRRVLHFLYGPKDPPLPAEWFYAV